MSNREVGGSFEEPRGGTTPLQPVPERSFAPVFPYRGTEQHGVPVEAEPWIPRDAEAQSWEGEEVFDPEQVPLEPIPVIVVNESETELRSWRAMQYYVGKQPALIIGQNTRMTRVRIRNMLPAGTDAVIWVGHESNISRLYGWPIMAGEILELNTEEEVYAVLDNNYVTADTAGLAIIIEHRVV